MLMHHKRAQTANPFHKHKHQQTILKEIKTNQELQKIQSTKHLKFSQMLSSTKTSMLEEASTSSKRKIKKLFISPFTKKLREIQRLNCKQSKSIFSFQKDEKRICQLGWEQFQQKIEKGAHKNLQKIRKKAHQIKNKTSIHSIFTNSKIENNKKFKDDIQLDNQKIGDIWSFVGREKENSDFKYIRVSELSKDIKESYVLKNAYTACLHSKSYKQSPQTSFTDQKFKSFVYLRQNQNKLSKTKLDEILKRNFFLQ